LASNSLQGTATMRECFALLCGFSECSTPQRQEVRPRVAVTRFFSAFLWRLAKDKAKLAA